MSPDQPRRLLLRDDASPHVMGVLASDLGWVLDEYVAPGPGRPEEEVYATGRAGTAAHFVDDAHLGVRYLVLRGPDAGGLAGELGDRAEFVSLDDTLSALEAAPAGDATARSLFAVAAAAPPTPDPRVAAAFDRAAGDEDPAVRRAVVLATGYLSWPQMRALLDRLRSDPDEGVRRDAALMLDGKDRYG